jgi:hypothetical protein
MSKIGRGGTERGRYWRRWLGKWEQSGLTQAEFCRRHGLKAGNFAWWKRKLGEAVGPLRPVRRFRGSRSPAQFVESSRSLRSNPRPPRARRSAEFVELTVPVSSTAPSRCSAGYEVILPRGVVIRLPVDFDSDRVAPLIRAAASAC